MGFTIDVGNLLSDKPQGDYIGKCPKCKKRANLTGKMPIKGKETWVCGLCARKYVMGRKGYR